MHNGKIEIISFVLNFVLNRPSLSISRCRLRYEADLSVSLDLSLFLSVSKHNMWWNYGWVCCSGRPAVNTIYGGIMVGFVVDVISQ